MLSKAIFIYTTNISNTQTYTYTHNIFNHNKHRDRKKSRAASNAPPSEDGTVL